MPNPSLTSLLTPRPLSRIIALLLSTTTTALLTSLLPLLSTNTTLNPENENSIAVGLPLAGTVWSILYNGFALLATARGWSWHPGVDIAFDCLGWMLNWGMGIVLFVWVGVSESPGEVCDDKRVYGPETCELAKKVVGMEYTSGALCVVVG